MGKRVYEVGQVRISVFYCHLSKPSKLKADIYKNPIPLKVNPGSIYSLRRPKLQKCAITRVTTLKNCYSLVQDNKSKQLQRQTSPTEKQKYHNFLIIIQ